MASIYVPGGGTLDGFPDRLIGVGQNGCVDNGRPCWAEAIERAERATHVLAARRKISIPIMRYDLTSTYSTTVTAPLMVLCKEMYSLNVLALGYFSVDNVSSTDPSDIRISIGINSTESATYTVDKFTAATANELYRFAMPVHVIGGGDRSDVETQEINVRLAWIAGSGSDTCTLHSITLIVDPMAEVSTT